MQAAQQRAASQLECSTATSEVLHKAAIEEPQGTGWHAPPSPAQYTVAISGCGKQATYSITCDERGKPCTAIEARSASAGPPPRRGLIDEMRPEAVRAAERRGSSDLQCPTATTRVLQENPIEEPQTTGWYEPPSRAE